MKPCGRGSSNRPGSTSASTTAQEKFEQLFLEQLHEVLSVSAAAGARPAASSLVARTPSAAPGLFRRLSDQARRSLGTLRRLGPRQAWTALRWFVNDRCFAAWLRWRLWQPGGPPQHQALRARYDSPGHEAL